MKKWFAFLIIFILTGFTMWLTNPGQDKHERAVAKAITEALSEEKVRLTEAGNLPPMLKELNEDMLDMMISPLVNQSVTREDYVVYSLTRLKLGAEDHRVGIGLFGKVFIAPQLKTTIKDNIQQYLK
jgi:hypothetical protein